MGKNKAIPAGTRNNAKVIEKKVRAQIPRLPSRQVQFMAKKGKNGRSQ
jgi:hypothetical protein